MKNIFFTLVSVLFFSFLGYSQSVSLDPNSLQLPRFSINPGCTVNDKGKLIFNTAQNAVLYCDGTEWKTTQRDAIYPFYGSILVVQATPVGVVVPWVFTGPTVTIVLDRPATIIGNAVGVFRNPINNPTPLTISANMCYQLTSSPGGAITPFANPNTAITDFSILASTSPLAIGVPVVGAVNLPAGTYKVGMAIKNKSTSVNLGPNDYVNGVIQVKY